MTDEEVDVQAAAEPTPFAQAKPTQGWRKAWVKIGTMLREVMDFKQYEEKGPSGKAKVLSYITARQVMDRLDEVVGPGAWSTEFVVHDYQGCIVECRLTVLGVTKADVGYPNSPGGSSYEKEPMKSAYSDAFKRAAVHHGIGRFLYGD